MKLLWDDRAWEDFKNAFDALRAEAADLPEMSLEEIDAEIALTRADRKRG